MKKLNKVLCLVLALAMLLQVSAFALGSTHITFTESEPDENGAKTVTAHTFAGLTGEDNLQLITAVYDASGNVVSADKAVTDGVNAVLGNTVSAKDGQTVKSFVWTADDHTPVEEIATMGYGASINPEDVEITFDGVDFETYIGAPLAFDESHTTEYHVSYENKDEIATPDVSVKVKENGLKAVVEKEDLSTTITIYGGNRIAIDDPTDAGMVTNINGEEKNKWVYNVGGKEYLDQSYEWPLCETIIIYYDGEGDTSYWTEEDLSFAQLGGHKNTFNYMASKSYTVAEGETKDITLTINTPSELTNFVVVKAKDNTKDVLVNSDGSAITWSTTNPASTSNAFSGVAAYDYRLKDDGSRDYSFGYESGRATGVEYYNTAITATATDASRKVYYGRNTQNGDGDYISGSVLTWERTVIANNRMFYKDIPEEYLGENYIAMPKAALKSLTFTITVNDNIDSIVMFSNGNNTAQYNIKDSEDEAVWAFTQGTYGMRRYQDTVTAGTYAFLKHLGYDPSKEIFSGRYIRENLFWGLIDEYGGNNVSIKSTSAYANKAAWNTVATTYSAAYEEDYKKTGNRTATELITTPTVCYDDYLEYFNEKGLAENTLMTPSVITGTWTPKAKRFVPHDTVMFADRSGYSNVGGTGALLRYPDYFNLENSVFIAPCLGWENTTSSFTSYVKDAEDYNNPIYSFDVNRDSRVMVLTRVNYKADNWLNTEWDKFQLPTMDGIHIMEKSISWPTESARPAVGTYFNYSLAYTKDFMKGDTVTIKSCGGSSGVPLVFVWEIDDIPHSVNAADIKVNGVSLDGFDADTLEYSYTLSEDEVANPQAPVVTVTNEDATADVEVTYDKEFPGGATVTVSHYSGLSKSYKINFVYDEDMVYDIVMCNDNSYAYTALKEVTDTSTGETTSSTVDYTITFTDGEMGKNDNTIAEYVKGGVKVGELGYTDRGNYKIESIADESYEGKDRIVGAISWYNGAQTMKTAFVGGKTSSTNSTTGITTALTPQGETYIPNWLNFKTKRGATVKVCNVGNTGNFANLATAGFNQEVDTSARFVIDINGKDRNQSYICAKGVDANTTVSVPNCNTGDSAYSVVLFYNDWE